MECPVCGEKVKNEDKVCEETVCAECGFDFETGEDSKPFRAEVD